MKQMQASVGEKKEPVVEVQPVGASLTADVPDIEDRDVEKEILAKDLA